MKILIGVESCQRDRKLEQVQRETWVRDIEGADVRFFLGRPEPADLVKDEVFLDVADDYDSLPAKTRALIRWAYEQGYDYLFKCDTDTYVSGKRILESGFAQHDYAGFVVERERALPYPQGGAGYWLSRRAMAECLAHAEIFDKHPIEDRAVAAALRVAGIEPHHDERYRIHYRADGQPEENNGYLTAHKCDAAVMRRIHLRLRPDTSAAGLEDILKHLRHLPDDHLQALLRNDALPRESRTAITWLMEQRKNGGKATAPRVEAPVPTSWDVFDTLMARRCVTPFASEEDPQMEREARELIPIAENVARVRPGDVLVSDMYLPESFLAEQIRRVTGLRNRLYVGPTIKRDGTIWPTLVKLGIRKHIGDQDYENARAKAAGMMAEQTRVAQPTAVEQMLTKHGLGGLARLGREVRLGTYDPQYRALELAQTQLNFPFLVLASVLLHRIAVAESAETLLLSSRDCWLWHLLQRKVGKQLGGKYTADYFWTSRIARKQASSTYLRYVESRMRGKTILVDLAGFGRTLPVLAAKTSQPNAPILHAIKYPDRTPNRTEGLLNGGHASIERLNFARHPMVVDVDGGGQPVYSNELGIDWESVPEIAVMHETFERMLEKLTPEIPQEAARLPEATLKSVMQALLDGLKDYDKALRFQNDILTREEPGILQELDGIGGPQILTRTHSEMPYLSLLVDMDALQESTLAAIRRSSRLALAAQSPKMAHDLAVVLGNDKVFFLPSQHPLGEPRREWKEDPEWDDVGCFGRLFDLKNPAVQAMAAIEFARQRGKKLRFHINGLTDHLTGKLILAALRRLTSGLRDVKLVEHDWQPREQFRERLAQMTIGLQCSLSESSNNVAVDMASVGLPMVVSNQVDWAAPASVAEATDSRDIAEKMRHAIEHPQLVEENRRRIQAHNDGCLRHWSRLVGKDSRVLFLRSKFGVDTGIRVVCEADAEMLRRAGIAAEVDFFPSGKAALKELLQKKQPTHVICEARFDLLTQI